MRLGKRPEGTFEPDTQEYLSWKETLQPAPPRKSQTQALVGLCRNCMHHPSNHLLYSFCHPLLTTRRNRHAKVTLEDKEENLAPAYWEQTQTGRSGGREEGCDSASSLLWTNPSDGPGSTPQYKGKIDKEGRNVRISQGEITQIDSHLLPDVEIVEEAGPSREVERCRWRGSKDLCSSNPA